MPLPPPLLDPGDAPRKGGSKLEARLWTPGFVTSFGIAGTGGALGSALTTGLLRLGEEVRKVRSLIEPELDCLRKPDPC